MRDDEQLTREEEWVDSMAREAEGALTAAYAAKYGTDPETIARELAAIKERARRMREQEAAGAIDEGETPMP